MSLAKFIGAFAILLAGSSTGCTTSPPATFYTLTTPASDATDAVTSSTFAHSIAVGPVSVPETVNRPQLVVSDVHNRVAIIESRRWASPLRSGIAEAVALDLSRALGTDALPMTQSAAAAAQFDVALDVERFELLVGDAAVLEVVWTIVRRGANVPPVQGRTSVREPVQPTSDQYDAVVAAEIRALASVAHEIALRLNSSNVACVDSAHSDGRVCH